MKFKHAAWMFLAIWLTLLVLVVLFKMRTAIYLMPVVTLAAVGYLIYVTIQRWSTVTDDKNKEENKNE
jgi:threonine/homoserine/homoserine lactone efflux protein